MVDYGYIPQMTPIDVDPQIGDPYTILFGPIVAMCYEYDDEGNELVRDITDQEFNQLCEDFKDKDSAFKEIFRLKIRKSMSE